MAVLKCKMCGGDLTISEGISIVECDFCGTTQTIPTVDNEKKTNLFNRANRMRIASEFDRASSIYESIIAEFPQEAEAYWGLCLCKYGIEYVDDPKTAEKIPTCHRTSFVSIFDDTNYNTAISYADPVAQRVYEDEAKAIDAIQKKILKIVNQEKPFDVFICYKETNDLGQRTVDSVIAYDIYEHLTDKGFKVFFARVTLEDKLGQEYEPYIFAALHSAKVMLVIGTNCEYYNAVWVKNEWSRYLALMKQDRSNRLLIPCYRDMDPYDLPDELSALQSQDMSKIGFMQDLIRGLTKVLCTSESQSSNALQPAVTPNNAAPLLRRAFMCLEDKEWEKADDFCEQALNMEPENAEAYLGKLMAELKVSKRNELATCNSFEDNIHYKKIVRFGQKSLQEELAAYLTKIKADRAERLYKLALQKMQLSQSSAKLLEAANLLQEISGYRDAESKRAECLELAHNLEKTEQEKQLELAREEARKLAEEQNKLYALAREQVCILSQLYSAAVKLVIDRDRCFKNQMKLSDVLSDMKKQVNNKMSALRDDIKQVGLFNFKLKNELKEQIAACENEYANLQKFYEIAVKYYPRTPHVMAILRMCQKPNQFLTVDDLMENEDKEEAIELVRGLSTILDSGLIIRKTNNQTDSYSLSLYPEPFEYIPSLSKQEAEKRALFLINYHMELKIQGDCTFDNIVATVADKIKTRKWSSLKEDDSQPIKINILETLSYNDSSITVRELQEWGPKFKNYSKSKLRDNLDDLVKLKLLKRTADSIDSDFWKYKVDNYPILKTEESN